MRSKSSMFSGLQFLGALGKNYKRRAFVLPHAMLVSGGTLPLAKLPGKTLLVGELTIVNDCQRTLGTRTAKISSHVTSSPWMMIVPCRKTDKGRYRHLQQLTPLSAWWHAPKKADAGSLTA